MSAVRAPLRSSTVLMAMVDPCSTSPSDGMRQWASARLSATPRVGSAGTVDVFDVTMRPSMQPTRSVNVPPMSTPTMFNDCAPVSEPDRNERIDVELPGLRHARKDPEFVERMADHVDRGRIPGAVVREGGDLAVVHLRHHARPHLDGLAGRLHGEVAVLLHETHGPKPAAQEALHHVLAVLDRRVRGEDDVRVEVLRDVAEQQQVARLAGLFQLVAIGGFLPAAVVLP